MLAGPRPSPSAPSGHRPRSPQDLSLRCRVGACRREPTRHLSTMARMRAVVQRVLSASVTVDGAVVGAIDEPGLLVLLGITHTDDAAAAAWTARKIRDLRILRDEQSAAEVGAPVLVVSQFT